MASADSQHVPHSSEASARAVLEETVYNVMAMLELNLTTPPPGQRPPNSVVDLRSGLAHLPRVELERVVATFVLTMLPRSFRSVTGMSPVPLDLVAPTQTPPQVEVTIPSGSSSRPESAAPPIVPTAPPLPALSMGSGQGLTAHPSRRLRPSVVEVRSPHVGDLPSSGTAIPDIPAQLTEPLTPPTGDIFPVTGGAGGGCSSSQLAGAPAPSRPESANNFASPWSSVGSVRHKGRIQIGPMLTAETDCAGFETINNYTLLEKIGFGTFGEVWMAEDSDAKKYAVKIIRKRRKLTRAASAMGGAAGAAGGGYGSEMPSRNASHMDLLDAGTAWASPTAGSPFESVLHNVHDDIRREVAIMKRLSHTHVVRLYEVIDDDDNQRLLLVMQYIPHGAILHMFPNGTCIPTDEPTATNMMRQIAKGLSYLHSRNVIHRDIKPSNLLLDRTQVEPFVYITDFGVSEVVKSGGALGRRGTPAYFAPELLAAATADASTEYGAAVDMWALGVTFYALVFGAHPFFDADWEVMQEKILKQELAFPAVPAVSDGTKNILRALLMRDPTKRMTCEELRLSLRRQTKTRVQRVVEAMELEDAALLSPKDREMSGPSEKDLVEAFTTVTARDFKLAS